MKFPYFRAPSSVGFIEYPTLKLHLVNPKNKQVFPNYIALVDSGASTCVFHGSMGDMIGIDVRSGKQIPFKGVTTEAGVQFVHPVTLVFGGQSIEIEAGFLYDLAIPFGLLGQQGFFDKFRVCFDKSKSEFEFTPKI